MGTHISKVKSITLDSWTPEQIESMKQWGNLKSNAKWNPYPELHPISISASDGEIERYIRNKYERMAFKDSKPLQSKNSTSSSKRTTNNNTKSVDRGNFDLALRQLKDMGFGDMTRNREVLATTNGDLSSAIEILCRLSGGKTKSASLNSNASSISNTLHKSDDEKLTHLKNLGFRDDAKNREILRRTGGNVEVAATLLAEHRHSATLENVSNSTTQNPLQLQNQTLLGSFSPPQNSGSQQLPGQNQSSNLTDIWGEFSQANIQFQQQQKAKLDKNAIMSLYNQPQPSAYTSMNQASSTGMMQSQPGQFGITSTGMMQQRLNQPQQSPNGQLGFPNQKNDFGLNNDGTSNNMIPYGNINQFMGFPSVGAYTGAPANSTNSFGAGDLNNGYSGLNPLSNGTNGLATNYGYGGIPAPATNNSPTVMQSNITAMGTFSQQSSIPPGNATSAFALNPGNSMNLGAPNSSYSSMTPNGGMNQQQQPLTLYGLQHTGGYPNGQQNRGFQQNSLL
ncbi:11204_t:CDS:2 [Acaulospora colombiana]|uniref:11204_t:CDS:1 n=1 Tax=Acaulospora colombiana TaxID=27376 RepID=A0ACA9LKD8_9GLOM|nr:11204_t:CDS:2 [Acaulospora colombiana]